MSYFCEPFFIFTFVKINHIISLKQTHLFLWGFFVKSSASRCRLAFAYFFANFVAYESVAYKKSVYVKNNKSKRFVTAEYSKSLLVTPRLKDVAIVVL